MTRTTFPRVRHAPMPPYVPEGWRLVPDHPTDAWIGAMMEHTSYPSVSRAIELVLRCAPTYGADQ